MFCSLYDRYAIFLFFPPAHENIRCLRVPDVTTLVDLSPACRNKLGRVFALKAVSAQPRKLYENDYV